MQEDPPPSLVSLCQRSQMTPSMAWYHFPDLCRQLVARAERDHHQRFVALQRHIRARPWTRRRHRPWTRWRRAWGAAPTASGIIFLRSAARLPRGTTRISTPASYNAATRAWRKSARSPSRSTPKASSPPSPVSPRSSPDHAISPAMPRRWPHSVTSGANWGGRNKAHMLSISRTSTRGSITWHCRIGSITWQSCHIMGKWTT